MCKLTDEEMIQTKEHKQNVSFNNKKDIYDNLIRCINFLTQLNYAKAYSTPEEINEAYTWAHEELKNFKNKLDGENTHDILFNNKH